MFPAVGIDRVIEVSKCLLSAAAGVAEAGAPAVLAALDAAEAAGKSPRAKAGLALQLAQYLDLDGVLSCCERLWPQWADNGCRMIELVRPPALSPHYLPQRMTSCNANPLFLCPLV